MTHPVAPVSGPPLVYPIQPIKPIVRRDSGAPTAAPANDSPTKSAPPPSAGRLLDISV